MDTPRNLLHNQDRWGGSMANADAHVLVVEDDRPMQRLLRRTLELADYRVDVAGNGVAALELLETGRPDIVLLDVILPGLDGIEVCRRIRERSQVPVVIISALGREEDKVRGLDAGADDYVTKPFPAGELLARVRAVLRRSGWSGYVGPSNQLLRAGGIEIDPQRHTVERDGVTVPVTPLEFRLLVYLVSNAGRVLTHNMILTSVWGSEYADELHMLRVNMSRLRQKLACDPDRPELVRTVPGVGYTVSSA